MIKENKIEHDYSASDKTILQITIAFCALAVTYFVAMTAPVIIPVLVAGIAELIKLTV